MTNNDNFFRAVTVGDLIAFLSKFDRDLPVQISMNQEYQNELMQSDLVGLMTQGNYTYVLIGD